MSTIRDLFRWQRMRELPSLLKLLRLLRPYRRRLAVLLAFTLVLAVFQGIVPLIVRYMVDIIVNIRDVSRLVQVGLAFLGLFVVRFLIRYGSETGIPNIGQDVAHDLRRDLFAHIQQLSMDFFQRNRVGELMSRFTGDILEIEYFTKQRLADFTFGVCALLVMVAVMFAMSWKLALISVVGFPLLRHALFFLVQRLRATSMEIQERRALLSGFLQENLFAMPLIKSLGAEDLQNDRFGRRSERLTESCRKEIRIQTTFVTLMGLTHDVALIVILAYGGYLVIRGWISVGSLVAFMVYLQMTGQAYGRILSLATDLPRVVSAADRVFALLAQVPTIRDAPNAHPLTISDGTITVEHVTFEYRPNAPVLHDISFQLQRGSTVAIVGPSGAGKTTLISLLSRCFDPTSGHIVIDGQDLRGVTLRSLRAKVTHVLQNTLLLNATVAENIAFATPDATPERIEAAARDANAHDFIMNLPQGYDTPIGDQGMNLAGGERQRIALARALLRNAPILMLDEATSSLDLHSEKVIQETLARYCQDKTTIIIAHRLATVRNASWILVMDGGRIVEQGTHADLIEREDGLYRRMHQQWASCVTA